MKIEVLEKDKKDSFPKLMKYSKNVYGPFIILVSKANYPGKEGVGTVVYSEDVTYPVGYYTACWGLELFEDFNGMITLENE